ncbi:aldo/keto reductase [Halopiger goleimassiliensis]|uniref:aldo/keto reductase n=1 Tax=Halopiger goleimassiliensis TaxID=1293048 RepID=UPI000678048E|nr:aldo/keto reductase [Halopiger goleimassiliensis]
MEYTTLGSTGTTVSQLCLGTMNLGYQSEGWKLGEEESREILERAIDLGINFIDTANVYRGGASESIVGDVIAEHDRDSLVVATKVYGSMDDDNPNAQGLSRKAIEGELANSLERLGLETIDLYQIHRWDDETPIEETLRTLDDAVRRNQVRYLGASSMWAYQFADALHTSDRLGLERFVTMQNHYNPVYREEEREMLPLCDAEGIGVIPWSPLARGYLTRPHDEFDTTARGSEEADERGDRHAVYRGGGGREINERVAELAADRGVSMAQLTIAWHLHNDHVTAPIVGVSSVEQLEEAAEAVDVSLSESDLEYLAEPYEPVPIVGHD